MSETMKAHIAWNSEVDKWKNPVSIITLENGKQFRMVRHSKSYHPSKRYTIYAGRNKFIKVRTYASDNDWEAESIMIADYYVEWGDGDMGTPINNPMGPDLKTQIQAMPYGEDTEEDFGRVILIVLTAIQDLPKMWMAKPETV